MKRIIMIIIILLMIEGMSVPVFGWWNGPFPSKDLNNPGYGTHDMILDDAIAMLPLDMKGLINMSAAFYGTEIPDCQTGLYCINDQYKHHVFINKTGKPTDIRGAIRAQEEYNLAEKNLKAGDIYNFSLHLGAMSHYISDLANYHHTLGNGSDWGPDNVSQHYDYEKYVDNNLSKFSTISFDGIYKNISAYDASIKMANETTFDSGIYTNVWMQQNYNWSNPKFVKRTKYLIGYSANLIADVIYQMLKDKSSPTTYIYGVTEGGIYNNNVTVVLNATDEGSGIDKTLLIINGEDTFEYFEPLEIYKIGLDNITYWSIDKEGNIEKPKIINFTIIEVTPTPTTTTTPTPTPTPTIIPTITPNITPTIIPTITPNITPIPTQPTGGGGSGGWSGSSSGGSGGGGGGGGLASAEPFDNILKFESQENLISAQKAVGFKYTTPEISVYEVDITGTQSDDVTLRIEALKGISKLVNNSVPGLNYKNINMWVNSKRISNATIKFKVNNSWIDINNINATTIRLLIWDRGGWKALETMLKSNDGVNSHFESKTTNFSMFAISSIGPEQQYSKEHLSKSEPIIISPNISKPAVTFTPDQAPGFGHIMSIISLIYIYIIYKIKKRN